MTRVPRVMWLSSVLCALFCAGCGHAASKPTSLFPHLEGARTHAGDLIIDEVHGRFAGLYLGMSIAQAKKVMPSANYWISLSGGNDLSYCSRPETNSCGGAVYLGVFGACEIGIDETPVCDSPDAAGPVVEIDLSANGNPLGNRESQGAVTLRGIRLGSQKSDVTREYKIAEKSDSLCGGAARPSGTTYVALAGKHTIAITTSEGVVQQISLIAGHHPKLCNLH